MIMFSSLKSNLNFKSQGYSCSHKLQMTKEETPRMHMGDDIIG